MKQDIIIEFEERIGYRFDNPDLLATALTHSSYSNEKNLKKYARFLFARFHGLKMAFIMMARQ